MFCIFSIFEIFASSLLHSSEFFFRQFAYFLFVYLVLWIFALYLYLHACMHDTSLSFILSNSLFEVPFPRLWGFTSCFWSLLWVSCVDFVLGGTSACFLVGGGEFFSSDRQRHVRWCVLGCLCSLSAYDCICVPVLLVACVKHPALGAAGRWVVPDLGFGWRHSWTFSLIPPGVRHSLTFQCPGLVALPLLFTVRSVIVFKWMLHIYLWKRLPRNGLPQQLSW